MESEKVPVLIVGGGCTGLTASLLLQQHGIEHLLVNDRPVISPYPKAHIINQRTVEILSRLGLADDIYRQSTPKDAMRYAAWYAGIRGDRANFGREIGRVEAWGSGYTDPDYVAASSFRNANIPQSRLEPILQRAAFDQADIARRTGSIRYGHEVVGIESREDGATATVRDVTTDREYTVEADYVIAADAGRFVGPALGIHFLLDPDFSMSMCSVYFSADLSTIVRGSDVVTRFLVNPELGGSWGGGVLFPEGPDIWGHHSQEWVFHGRYDGDTSIPVDRELVLDKLRQSLGLPDFAPEVHMVNSWTMDGGYAEQYRHQRVLLAGDAAHRHPPTGGLNLNAGVQDAYNLVWKLVFVLRGQADPSLLDSYEVERQPVAAKNVAQAITNARSQFRINTAIGIDPDADADHNWAQMDKVWDTSEENVDFRRGVARAISAQRILFRHLGSELGHEYPPSQATLDDGSPPVETVDAVLVAPITTRPGHHLPHAWFQDLDKPVASADLVPFDGFLLITGTDGDAWLEAAEQVQQEFGVPVRALQVGVYDGDYIDVRAHWERHKSIGPDGAVLVRPDRYIAWRVADGAGEEKKLLTSAVGHILGKNSGG